MNDDNIGRGQKIPAILPGEISKHDPGDGTHAAAVTGAVEPLRSAGYWAVYGAMVAVQVQYCMSFGRNMDDETMRHVVEDAHATAAWAEEVQP
jgi:hypothetical protein